MQRRAAEVTNTVVASWSARVVPPEISDETAVEVVTRASRLAAELIGRYLADGTLSTVDERERLAASGALTVVHDYTLTDLTKTFLTWRDAVLRVLDEEVLHLGLPKEVGREAAAVVRASADSGLVGMVREFDVERQELRERLTAEHAKLSHLALHDPLTGLPNRTLMMDRLSHAVSRRTDDERRVAVLFLDLDGFKAVNDTYGHRTGDQLLVAVADCLTGLVRPSDTVARMGGDEFVIVYDDVRGGEPELAALAERIQAGVTATCADHSEVEVTVSIGAVLVRTPSDPERTLAEADAAMYAAKRPSSAGSGPPLAEAPVQPGYC